MKFSPCISQCSHEGTHCEGCGRTHEEINATSDLVNAFADFLEKMNYDDPELVTKTLSNKALRRYRQRVEMLQQIKDL